VPKEGGSLATYSATRIWKDGGVLPERPKTSDAESQDSGIESRSRLRSLPDRSIILHSKPMTTQTTQETNTTSTEPTWTDVARAVFRTGKRQMPIDEFIVTFLRLFRELQQRCPDTGFTTRRLMESIKELHDGGFLDGANIASFVNELREWESKRKK
jgi:hypothetical protein